MVRALLALVGLAGFMAIVAVAVVTRPDYTNYNLPFGGPRDIGFAADLWESLAKSRLIGRGAIHSHYYEGIEPHGFLLETFDTEVDVRGRTGRVIVKRNYGPPGVEAEVVANFPDEHLDSVTVMFRREQGYDPDTGNWFWAKYFPDGKLDLNPAGLPLAGRVAKGADTGCIACHTAADGEDYLFITDRGDDRNRR